MMKRKNNQYASARKFVEIWQTSDDVDEVQERLPEVLRTTILARASRYRSHGVPLKQMPHPGIIDWQELSDLAKDLFQDEGVNNNA